MTSIQINYAMGLLREELFAFRVNTTPHNYLTHADDETDHQFDQILRLEEDSLGRLITALDDLGLTYIEFGNTIAVWYPALGDFVYFWLHDVETRTFHDTMIYEEEPLRRCREYIVLNREPLRPNFGLSAAWKSLAVGMIQRLPAPIIRHQLIKALKQPRPSFFFETLSEIGHEALEAVCWPLAAGVDVLQDSRWHTDSVYKHALKVVDASVQWTSDPLVRLGAMLHDCGKSYTRKEELVEVPNLPSSKTQQPNGDISIDIGNSE